jgi:hypothetical protein
MPSCFVQTDRKFFTNSLSGDTRGVSSLLFYAKRGLDQYRFEAVAKFLVPDWGDIVDSGIGLSNRPASSGGHRHLQIGRLLDIDLISEPSPPPPTPICMYPKCGICVAKRGRKQFIASWGLRMSYVL